MNISKSRYTRGVQCPKMLWMEEHMKDWYDESVLNQSVLANGNAVGDLAMGYFGDFVEVPFDPEDPDRFKKAAAKTQELLAAGERVICEATFELDGNYCMVDILKRRQDGTFDMVEVKSSTSIHDIYLHDMAFQSWLVFCCGIRLASVSLMHVNNQYVREGELDLRGMFTVEDCTEVVFLMLPEVPGRVAALKALADGGDEPALAVGPHCLDPYPCGYRGWCWREVPKPSVFDLSRITKKKAFALYGDGLASFEELAGDAAALGKLNAKQRLQVRAHVEGLPPQIDVPKIRDFLDILTFPLYFLDFETFQPAIPPFDGTRPFQQIPTQYSLHWLEEPGGELRHAEFLAEAGSDPRRSVAEHLVADIPDDVCVLAYNMSFEKGRIQEMTEMFPDLADHLMRIHENVRDLMVPFQQGAYYCDAMQGSYSIKYVLPALFPGDPELDYHALEGVHNGSEAMAAFADLPNMAPEDVAFTRERLLRYCELDTYAMVKVWQKLAEVTR